ncbi:hypothetical protein I547_1713 [Mycobacterium kansasii 824]|uniref:Uncharacterized protein n=1 Tax=Mycobacterium kansasii TaxID=1768 RepID=A0A1V3WGJ2_MYCKA|nr:hypothetical protein I547_1713 [Mycobacterium kansasii 824]OOK65546.1 hypothetical protein BZL30_8786 [Mycobacterium kansasii]
MMAVLAGGCGSDNPVIDSSNRGSNSHTVHISPAAPLEIPFSRRSPPANRSNRSVRALPAQPLPVSVYGLRESARPGTSVAVTLVFDCIRQLRRPDHAGAHRAVSQSAVARG